MTIPANTTAVAIPTASEAAPHTTARVPTKRRSPETEPPTIGAIARPRRCAPHVTTIGSTIASTAHATSGQAAARKRPLMRRVLSANARRGKTFSKTTSGRTSSHCKPVRINTANSRRTTTATIAPAHQSSGGRWVR
jgi:hypothetical protein